jgi:hypothetical protein
VRNAFEIGVSGPRGTEDLEESDQIDPFEHAPRDAEARQHSGDVRNRLGRQPIAPAEQAGYFANPVELSPNPVQVVCRASAPDPAGTERSYGVCRDQLQDGLELENGQRVRHLRLGQW